MPCIPAGSGEQQGWALHVLRGFPKSKGRTSPQLCLHLFIRGLPGPGFKMNSEPVSFLTFAANALVLQPGDSLDTRSSVADFRKTDYREQVSGPGLSAPWGCTLVPTKL